MKPMEILALTIMTLVWGTLYAVAGYAIRYFPPILLYSMRFLIAGICLIPFTKFSTLEWKKICLFGTLQAIMFVGITVSLKHIDSSITAIVLRFDIPMTMLFAALFFKEKITWNLVIGCLICFFGIYVISGDVKQKSDLLFIFLLVLSTIISGLSNMVPKILNEKVSYNLLNAEASFVIAIELLLVSFLFGEDVLGSLQNADLKIWILMLYLGIFPAIIGYHCFYYLLKRVPTNKTFPYHFIRPFVALISGAIVLGEFISQEKIWGLILTTIGIALSQINFDKFKK